MIKRFILLGAVSAMVVALTAPGTAQALPAPHGALCTLHGAASFTPGLTAKPAKVSYTFTGTLSNCEKGTLTTKPTPPAPPSTASVSASGASTLKGISCEAGTSAGTAHITFSTGAATVAFKTYSAGALTIVQGKVTGSTDKDIKAGDQAASLLAFQTSTPQACAQGGLASATFDGVTGSGFVK